MSYTDLTADFEYQDLVVWSKMDQLAENDAYDHLPTGTRTLFYQVSAPAAWTKIVTQNDKILRVVSGAGGGSGGAASPSSAVTLAHTHAVAHVHTHPSHTHLLKYRTETAPRYAGTPNAFTIRSNNTDGQPLGEASGVSSTVRRHTNDFAATTPSDTGSTDPGTDSQLTNFTLAYADVIVCEKN